MSPEALQLLEGIISSVEAKLGTAIVVGSFTPKFFTGGMWHGRLDYMEAERPVVGSLMLEGSDYKVDQVHVIRRGDNGRAVQRQRAADYAKYITEQKLQKLIQLDLDGPGYEREL
jgi:hypothetical protein